MTLKKMLLILGAAMALVAFAAPAMAQAEDEWYTEVGEDEFETLGDSAENGDTVELTGTLTSTKFPLKQSCNVHVQATLWNEPTATGEVESIVYTVPTCTVAVFNLGAGGYVDVPGCEITEVESVGFSWELDVATGTNATKITGANFTNTYNGCGALGIPNGGTRGASGTATGTVNGGCIEFNGSGDLVDEGSAAVLLDGSVCNSSLVLK